MQVANVNLPVTVTGRHVSITDAMREHALKKVDGLHLDYPKIIDAKVLLDVEGNHRHIAEVILFCANHITIEADSTTDDMYASIDETFSKIARRMRKYKTRMLKSHRPKKGKIREIEEQIFSGVLPELTMPEDDETEELEPLVIEKRDYKIKPLYNDEAIMEMELSERSFIVFEHAKTHKLSVIFRRKNGDYGLIEPELPGDK